MEDDGGRRRRSIRLPAYDYGQAGACFVTLCTAGRRCLFGTAARGEVWLNGAGRIALECWQAIPDHFGHLTLDAFVVMPNHLHGIVVCREQDRRGMACHAPTAAQTAAMAGAVQGAAPARRFSAPEPGTLSAVIGSFKSAVTREINRRRGTSGAAVWQRNCYEHVIRNEDDLRRIRRYVADNPPRWDWDEEDPERVR